MGEREKEQIQELQKRLAELYEMHRLCWSLRIPDQSTPELGNDAAAISQEIHATKDLIAKLKTIPIHKVGVTVEGKSRLY